MIDRITIDQVMERANVFDVVSDFIDLKKNGTSFKACCPFHHEKTPSFVVTPGKDIWHCFGCGKGGNAVDFIMEHEGLTYPEAIKWLCKKYGIECKEDSHDYTEEEKNTFKKKESLFIITQAAGEFYAKQLHESDKECKEALAYVNRRWNHRVIDEKTKKPIDDIEKDFPSLMGIGYAKGWDSFYQYAVKRGYSEALMEEVGLIKKSSKGNWIDVFHHRITIPIRDKYRHVLGFTCRTLDEDRLPPKYLNSCDSILYHKGNNIFGIDNAVKQAVKEQRFYCVEGAPDAMQLHSLGVDNAIAGLGTAWTKEMFGLIKKYNATLCFIPDEDKPKIGEKWGVGIKAVEKTGRMAIEQGFRVTVKEIPSSKAGKQDADSYFKNKHMLFDLPEEDFVVWYASKEFETSDNTTERSDKIKDVCSIVAYVQDEYTQDALIEKLGNRFNGKNRWKAALKEVKKEIDRKRAAAISKKGDIDLLKKYGFMEENNCYYGENGNKQWSNFTMKPLFHIKDSFNAKRIYKMKNIFGRTELIELKTEELISLPKFQQHVESLGNYLWMATMEELKKLKEYLYENTDTAEEIKQLGWNKAGFFVWGNGIFFEKTFFKVDDYGIVRLERTDDEGHSLQDNYYLPAMSKIYADERELFKFERRFAFNSVHSSISLPDFCVMMENVFGDNAKIGIEFLLATLFRDIIVSYTKNYPILNLFGPKGSGKSELAHSLMGFFIKDDTGINIQNATIAALADAIAQCSNALVHIDEYKNNVDPIKIEFLKGLYDGTGRSRMNMELDKKRQITAVDSAVVLSGQEMPTVDIALFSRTIYLTFESTTHTREQKQKFKELSTVRAMGVPHLTNEIIMHRDIVSSQFYDTYNEVLTDLEKDNNGEIEDRIWRNWGMLLSVYKILQQPLRLPWEYKDMREFTSQGIRRQNQECATGNELGAFWDMFEYMVSEGMIFIEGDYKIKYLDKIKTNVTDRDFGKTTPVLMMRPKHIILQYKKASRMTDERTMSERSIRFYLLTSPGYIGKKAGSERFKVVIDGQIQKKQVNEGVNISFKDVETFDNPLCFDYSVLQQVYGINLEQTTDEDKKENKIEIKKDEQQDLPF